MILIGPFLVSGSAILFVPCHNDAGRSLENGARLPEARKAVPVYFREALYPQIFVPVFANAIYPFLSNQLCRSVNNSRSSEVESSVIHESPLPTIC